MKSNINQSHLENLSSTELRERHSENDEEIRQMERQHRHGEPLLIANEHDLANLRSDNEDIEKILASR